MSFLDKLYSKPFSLGENPRRLSSTHSKKTLIENDKNTRFWEDYLKNLKSLELSVFSEKLTVPILVPIGSRIFFRGHLQHTNALTVSIGADYFVKCSINQAEVLRQHRIRDAQSKVDALHIEREHILNRITFSKENIFENQGHEIIESFNEEDEKLWRKKHRENIRQYKQGNTTIKETVNQNKDEELWDRLEELELQEELENELQNLSNETNNNVQKFLESGSSSENDKIIFEKNYSSSTDNSVDKSKIKEIKAPQQTSKLDLLQQVLNKQNELENKLLELKNRQTTESKTEHDLLSRLNEMEQLDDLEDDMNRLDDVLQSDNEYSEENQSKSSYTSEIKKSVSFADQDDSATLEITFKHSEMEPCMDPYDAEKGILKPSDVYVAYSYLFANETTSILRKSNYENKEYKNGIPKQTKETTGRLSEINRTIVVQDIVEKKSLNKMNMDNSESRPASLFKLRRQNKK